MNSGIALALYTFNYSLLLKRQLSNKARGLASAKIMYEIPNTMIFLPNSMRPLLSMLEVKYILLACSFLLMAAPTISLSKYGQSSILLIE